MDRLLTSFISNILAVLLFTTSLFSVVQSSRKLTIVNKCRSTIWPVIQPVTSGTPNGFILRSNESKTLSVPRFWSGRIWGRTHCFTNTSTGNFSCLTADCLSGKLEYCNTSGRPPLTPVEITMNKIDYYDVSLVDGFNLLILMVPGGHRGGKCSSIGCLTDLNSQCPWELSVRHRNGTVACKTACDQAFHDPSNCCFMNSNATSQYCRQPPALHYFKKACPLSFSYVYDNISNVFTCGSAEYYSIIFCQSPNTSLISGRTFVPAPGQGALVPIKSEHSRFWVRVATAAAALLLVALLSLFCCPWRNGHHRGRLYFLNS